MVCVGSETDYITGKPELKVMNNIQHTLFPAPEPNRNKWFTNTDLNDKMKDKPVIADVQREEAE